MRKFKNRLFLRKKKMQRTIILLIATLVALPFLVLYLGQSPTAGQWELLQRGGAIMLAVALTCFVVSEWSKNYSQVDKIWSLIPIVYAWFFAFQGGLETRLLLMAFLVTVWGARLTYNFGRRGGYHWVPWKGEEDYRWAVLRKQPIFKHGLSWTAFNLLFISLYQNALIFLFTLPILAAVGSTRPLGWLDFLATGLMLGFVALETIADEQQYRFQEEKYRRINSKEPLDEPYSRGFVNHGLWKMVRHPNYACEQGVWLSFYLFSVAATGQWVNWSLTGALLLVLLFLGSSNFSEEISASKYPEYVHYQKNTPRFIPGLRKRSN